MTKGRRTNVFIQNDVAIDEDGMENLDEFWGAAGQANISMGSPSILFEQTPPPSPSFQGDTFQTPSPRKSPSAISLSPSSAMTPIGVPEKRITIETPSKTPERATEQEIPRMNRLRNSPMPETTDLMKAINDARAVSNVKLPAITPARPVQKPVLKPQVQPPPQFSAPKQETPVRSAPKRFDVPEVRFDFQTPEVFKRLDRELASVPEPTYDVRPAFQRKPRFDEAPVGDWRVWRPPEEVERPTRPVFDDIAPERVVPQRKPDEMDGLGSFSEPKAFGTGESRRPRFDKDYEFGSYGTGPIFAPFKREPAKPAGEKRMHFDRVPNLSSDSDSELYLGPEPVRPRRTGRVTLDVEPLNPEPVRANRIERLSRARQSPVASKYLEPVRLNPFADDSDSSEPDANLMGGVSNMGRTGSVLKQRPMEEEMPPTGGKREPIGSLFKKPDPPQFGDESPPRGTPMETGGGFFGNRSRPRPEQLSDGDTHLEPTGSIFKKQNLEEIGGEEPPGENKFFGILRRTVNVASQVSRGHTPMKKFEFSSGTEQTNQQKAPKFDSAEQVDIPPEERPIRYVFGGHDSDSEEDEIHFEQKYESIRPELPTMSNFNFRMGMGSTEAATTVSSTLTQPKAPKSMFGGTMPATPKFEVEEHRRHRRHRRSSGVSENQPPVMEESPTIKPTYMNPSMTSDTGENPPMSGDQSPEFLRRSPSPIHPAYSMFEQGVVFGDGDSDQYEKMVADVDSPPPMPSDGDETGEPEMEAPQPAPLKAEEPRRRTRQKRTPRPAVDYSQMDDLDRPIALRRTKRPRTKPLKYWKGEKIIYQCDENGLYTQQGVHRVSDDEDEMPRPTKKTSRKPVEKEIEVLPARVLPGEADEQKIKYTGLANKAMITDEYEILPRRSMVFKAVKQRMILHVSHGKAKLHAHDKKWVIGAGGMIYITRGDSCRITNRSTTEPVRLFETSM